MTLHIFNPEHDLALACNQNNFTAPHAARQLHADLGFIPAIWAVKGDAVLVDDADYARKAIKKFETQMGRLGRGGTECNSAFIEISDISSLYVSDIDVWGWDAALCNTLISHGVDKRMIPNLDRLETIRQLSHRRYACDLLQSLRTKGTVGEAYVCTNENEVQIHLARIGQIVIKAPWSSSGRGLRFAFGTTTSHQDGWIKNMLKAQGSVMVEPYYKKVKDFGMEFYSNGLGTVTYLGLSLFNTTNGAYTGNVLATESTKMKAISRYVSESLLDDIKSLIIAQLGPLYNDRYKGPFGIDMMIVQGEGMDGFLLHPCVEINLRRTMGHVALCMSPTDDDIKKVMRVTNTGNNYQLKIQPL